MRLSTKQKVYVGMSGGVDSSVAAALLKKQGFEVHGVFMKPWQPSQGLVTSGEDVGKQKPLTPDCIWEQDREDAMRVAAVLDIPLYTWDFSEEYGREVTTYMVEAYRKGRTPNPDVMCNKEIKFGVFLKKALAEGADFIATGHYARVEGSGQKAVGRETAAYTLRTSVDGNKDQTYFLWTLTQEQLSKTLFPIGDLTKPEVRKLAKKFRLTTFDKKDSQGVCFIGPLNMRDFLKSYIAPKSGNILDMHGKTIGKHDGASYYTIGQRHGLNITLGGGPYLVVSKNIKNNTVTVGKENDLLANATKVTDMHWIGEKPKLPGNLDVKIRYRTKAEPATLQADGTLKFEKSQRAITPGQSAVFYKDSAVLGGGIIAHYNPKTKIQGQPLY